MYDMKRKLVTLAIWSVLFAACSQSEYTRLEENQKEVRFSIYQSQMSRAGKVCFNVGDSIGIFAVKRTTPNQVAIPGTSGNQAHNAKWVKTENGWRPASPIDKVVWSQDGTPIDFYAYYPYSREAINPEAIKLSVSTTQDVASPFDNSDDLLAENTQGLTDGEVELWFGHLFSLVNINLKSESFEIDSSMLVTARDVGTAILLNLGTGVQTPMGTANVTFYRASANDNVWSGILPPQRIVEEQALLQFEQSGEVYIYKTNGVNLTAGNHQKFEINLKSN